MPLYKQEMHAGIFMLQMGKTGDGLNAEVVGIAESALQFKCKQ